ncbi:OmpA family protein [Nafulsella turpanensis]|uniref:OmpA family protein n=1 Tax=Nafulsella turpanensis TaxID=1265690 RepID=UPI00034BA237|nr:OmpA family protein [Nafulsella turpanensis]
MKKLNDIILIGVALLCLWSMGSHATAQGHSVAAKAPNAAGFVYDPPQKLSPVINSEAEESMPVLSADGKTLYFVRILHPENLGGKFAGHDIWYSNMLGDSSWSKPKNSLLNLNNKGNNAILGFSEKDETVYLLNHYNSKDSRNPGISFARQEKPYWWTMPEPLDIPDLKKDGFFYNAYVNREGNVAIVSMKTRKMTGDEDLFVTIKGEDGEWSRLKNLGTKINTQGFEITPFLSQDGKTMYFSSNGHSGFGDADIYRVQRLDESWTNWSAPENLGRPLNSKGFDAAYNEHENGTVLFISNRDGYLADIYASHIRSAQSIEEERLLAEQKLREQEALEAERRRQEEEARRLAESNKEEIVLDRVYPLTVSIYFAFDSHSLSDESKARLTEIFQKYTSGQDVRVELIGHTDAIGTPQYNDQLSIKRAKAAENFLLSAGLAKERVHTEGRGEAEPAAPNETPEGRRQNRRVKIMVVK